jgi:hypothetical protein
VSEIGLFSSSSFEAPPGRRISSVRFHKYIDLQRRVDKFITASHRRLVKKVEKPLISGVGAEIVTLRLVRG